MEHQDWNQITIYNVAQNKQREEAKKQHSNKVTNPEEVKMEPPKQLGQQIAQARTTVGKNQKMLATEIGISAQILSRWETNKEIPSNADIAKIEKILKIKLPRCKKIKET